MANRYNEFTQLVESMEVDFDKFYGKDVMAAGARIRKSLQTLAGLCKEVRKDVTEVKNAKKGDK